MSLRTNDHVVVDDENTPPPHDGSNLDERTSPPNTTIVVSGSGSTLSAQPYCDFTSSPSDLVGPTRGTDFVCMIAIDGSIAKAWFVVAAGASGSHSVVVRYDMGRQVSAPVGFSTDCLAAKPPLATS